MATYDELLAQYNAITNPFEKNNFLLAHPKFAARLQGTTSTPTTESPAGGRGGEGAFGGGGGTAPLPPAEPEEEEEEETERPPKPSVPADLAAQGWDYVWNDDTESWELQQNASVSTSNRERLRAQFRAVLAQYGQDTPGNVALIEQAVANGWTMDKFLLEWRASPDYLANPIFAANMERVKQGKAFIDEGTLLRRRDEQKRLAKQYGFEEPSDNYIAQGMLSGLSDAEVEHRFAIQKNVNDAGAGVRWVYENILGQNITDQDLYEIFDPEIDTAEREEAYRDAFYRGRPMLLGLGIRSQAEADALQMLLGPGEKATAEAFARYEKLGANASRFQRLGAIEDLITQGLPDDFGNFSTEENSTLVRALLFNDQEALARMQDVISREIARFRTGAGVQATQGQLVGLLGAEERASYG